MPETVVPLSCKKCCEERKACPHKVDVPPPWRSERNRITKALINADPNRWAEHVHNSDIPHPQSYCYCCEINQETLDKNGLMHRVMEKQMESSALRTMEEWNREMERYQLEHGMNKMWYRGRPTKNLRLSRKLLKREEKEKERLLNKCFDAKRDNTDACEISPSIDPPSPASPGRESRPDDPDHIVRYGTGLMLEHGFYKTEEGKAELREFIRRAWDASAPKIYIPKPKPRPWLKKKHTKAQKRKKHERNRRRR